MYRIIEVADILGVSKVTVYKKIELLKPEIVVHMQTEQGVTYISDAGVRLIKKSIKRRKTRKPKDKASLQVVDLNCELEEMRAKMHSISMDLTNEKKLRAEDNFLHTRYLSAVLNAKQRELRNLEKTAEEIRSAVNRANDIISALKSST